MPEVLGDLRRALRTLRREPGFVLAAVATLSLGIGANSAMFGVVDALMYRPPPGVRDPAGLVRVKTVLDPAAAKQSVWFSGFTPGDLAALGDVRGPFATVAGYATRDVSVGVADVRKLPALLVNGDYFSTLRVRMEIGRPISRGDDAPGSAPVAVVSYDYWQRALGGDSSALGRTIHVGEANVAVAGVAPRGFVGMDLGAIDLWLPLAAAPLVGQPIGANDGQISIAARLRPDVSPAAATAAATATMRARDRMTAGRTFTTAPRLVVLDDAAHRIVASRGENPVPVWLLGATLAVLLVACANVVSLTLARAERRRRESAVRVSLGAGPWRLAREAFAESALLALGGALGGVLVAAWSVRIVQTLALPPLPDLLSARVVALTASLALLAMLLSGLGPAITAGRVDPASTLGAAGRTSTRRARAHAALTSVQVAVTLTLLITAGLFVRSFRNARDADVGYDLQHSVVVSLDMTSLHPGPDEAAAMLALAGRRLRTLPGVRGVVPVAFAPFTGMLVSQPSVAGGTPPADRMALGNMVGPGYFETVGARLRSGRSFTAAESEAGADVVVLNEHAARAFFPAGDALGRCIVVFQEECSRVVGIVRNLRSLSVTEDDGQFLYVPMQGRYAAQSPAHLIVRTTGDPSDVLANARSVVQSVNPRLPYVSAATALSFVEPQLTAWRVVGVAFTVFGVTTLLLASVGLYAVIAYSVAQRTRELGIRMALGALQRDVQRMVVGQGVRVAAVGLVLGAGGALAVGVALRSRLYGVSYVDPVTYLAVAALLALSAVLASWLPARRAARVDPAVALRAE